MGNVGLNAVQKTIKSISKEEWLVGGAIFLVVYVLVSKFRKKAQSENTPTVTMGF